MADEIGNPKIRGPKDPVKKGELVEIKSLIKHPMESGSRKDKATDALIPAHFIESVVVEYAGKQVVKATWSGAVSKDPFFSFFVKADVTGPLKMTWKDNKGQSFSAEATITVA
ncbi:MAG: thiosulfate oxidation carrier complex protein SoxZ [Magnetococcales bacterium]|nr:thiosulfate oxidation carrier complex protein SoxZ [Magnetococcales bacterium]MBF0114760.1 thiosulfate oxidation carrier complex protein SoxZ [Magnetococcales bacterium]